MITLQRDDGPMRYPLIVNDDGRDILVQTDTDYPGVASSFGWYIGTVPASDRAVQVVALGDFRACVSEHDGTDGTIDCGACGQTAAGFIEAARAFLADNVGATADDPGYFDGDA